MLVRTGHLQYLDPRDVVKDYRLPDFARSYSGKVQGLNADQVQRLGGMMVWDLGKGKAVPLHREQVGFHFTESGIDPAKDGKFSRQAAQRPRGRRHADLPTAFDPLPGLRFGYGAPDQSSSRDLIVRWARDSGTIKPAAIHNGEGVCPLLSHDLDGAGSGLGAYADGQYRQVRHRMPCTPGDPGTKSGFRCDTVVRRRLRQRLSRRRSLGLEPLPGGAREEVHYKKYYYGEEPGFWNHGDTALIVNTPKYGRKVFTGKTHMPSCRANCAGSSM
ncbi:MAG: hypothetical protein U0361_20600 [Nitrospiraceae bacterium]